MSLCTCPVESAIHHPGCAREGLLMDVGAFEIPHSPNAVTTDVRARAMREPRERV